MVICEKEVKDLNNMELCLESLRFWMVYAMVYAAFFGRKHGAHMYNGISLSFVQSLGFICCR